MAWNMTSIEAAAGNVSQEAIAAWRTAAAAVSGDLGRDRQTFSAFWFKSRRLIESLPAKPARNDAQAHIAAEVDLAARQSRERFLQRHVEAVYTELTQDFSRFVRVEHLVQAAADAFPGLVPSAREIATEAETLQGHKNGLEIDQGIFLAQVLGHERAGNHLVHAMLLPRAETAEYLQRFQRDGVLDLGADRK